MGLTLTTTVMRTQINEEKEEGGEKGGRGDDSNSGYTWKRRNQ